MSGFRRGHVLTMVFAVVSLCTIATVGCGGSPEPLRKPSAADRTRESVSRKSVTGPNDRPVKTGRRPG